MAGDPTLEEFAREVCGPRSAIDLARAALVMARLEYPDLDVGRFLARLDELAESSGVRAPASATGGDELARLHRLREYLFAEVGFAGNRHEYFDPRNSFLNDVLDRRLGIPITLSLVLIAVGRRVGLDLHGIGLPGHFIVGLDLGGDTILLDPFNRGRILTRQCCEAVVLRAVGQRLTLTPDHFAPVDARQYLARMLNNLKAIYWRTGAWPKAVAVVDRLLVLAPEAAVLRRDRGTALVRMGQHQRGLADWESYLAGCPDARDFDEVRSHLRQVRAGLARLN
jgi:regulator of sirC expression with transglutaminase-like and TPR domain